LIRLQNLFLLESRLWLRNISEASMPLLSYPKLHNSQQKRRQQLCVGENSKVKREIRENNLRSKAILFQKNPRFWEGRARNLKSI
jgi:hypothetical protein